MASDVISLLDPPLVRSEPDAAQDRSVSELVDLLAENGALGVLAIDLSYLSTIGARLGSAAYDDATQRLEKWVRKSLGPRLAKEDMLFLGFGHRGTLSIWYPRPRRDAEFYEGTLPALASILEEALNKLGDKLVFPYTVETPYLGVGHSLALSDRAARPEKTLVDALTRARERAIAVASMHESKLTEELIGILRGERVESVYEPIVELSSGRTIGFEALARGPWATRLESPMQLFRVAERAGLTFELDCLCRRAAMRGAAGRLPADAMLFLNCLPSAIHDPAFSGPSMRETLESAGLEPARLVLEISERETLANAAILRRTCDLYRSVGIKIALDDVGSSYASMAAAMDIAPDVMKIDLSIVRGLENDPTRQTLVSSLLTLADRMGSRIVAEGVEHQAERDTLQRLGVDWVQGYLFKKPGPL